MCSAHRYYLREWLSWWSTTLPRSGSRVRVPSRALVLIKKASVWMPSLLVTGSAGLLHSRFFAPSLVHRLTLFYKHVLPVSYLPTPVCLTAIFLQHQIQLLSNTSFMIPTTIHKTIQNRNPFFLSCSRFFLGFFSLTHAFWGLLPL